MADAYHMTQSEYARHRQISQPRIAQYIRVGKLNGAFKKKGRRYYIDPEKADKLLEDNLNPIYRSGKAKQAPADTQPDPMPAKGGNGRTLNEATRLLAWYRAALAKLKYEKESGALVSKEQVDQQAANVGVMVRTHLESMPAKLAPEVAAMRSPKKIAERIQREVHRILTALSHDIDKL
jgi:hypothetical protein